jgi:hypothetical protein
MTPSLRRFALTAHLTCSVGLLGSIAAFLALAVAGLTTDDPQLVRSAYPAMALIARFVIVALAFASLLTGLVQSLGTPWGLFRHYWVVAKLALTLFATIVLLVKLELIGYASRLAEQTILPAAELRAAGLQLVMHAAGGLLVLLVPAILSVYKPAGLTAYGRRKPLEQRAPSQRREPAATNDTSVWSSRGSIIRTPRGAYVLGFIAIVVAAHVVVLHLASSGLVHH